MTILILLFCNCPYPFSHVAGDAGTEAAGNRDHGQDDGPDGEVQVLGDGHLQT